MSRDGDADPQPDEGQGTLSDRGLSVRAKLKAIAANRRPVRRMSGAELESAFDGWAIEKRAQLAARTPEDNARALRKAGVATIGTLILTLLAAAAVSEEGYRAQQAENSERIASLTQEVAHAEEPRNDEESKAALTALATDVSEKAESVAKEQQGFIDLYLRAASAPTPGDGAPSPEMEEVAEHRRALAPYFADETLVLDDTEAYQWSTAVSHGPGTIDPRYAWYVRHDGRTPSPESASIWAVESAMPVVGEESMAHAVWTCTDTKTEDVLAWASADFDGETGTFVDFALVVTTAGAEHLSTDESSITPKKDGGRSERAADD
ncbi:hypothetical protein NE857_21340 [Nocardiopsis exhalans]|uniref:Uncharacterized protein n=1 Tax=Nocardiopsis exhalans TaxID=163604 RepID=A0ABY5D438_9ACTN|nr:hypothetical protein [Nocardiopsis exhalans]USY17861.1 hypothetical protein NE857_21340 [Nocardiopsis exhalans]